MRASIGIPMHTLIINPFVRWRCKDRNIVLFVAIVVLGRLEIVNQILIRRWTIYLAPFVFNQIKISLATCNRASTMQLFNNEGLYFLKGIWLILILRFQVSNYCGCVVQKIFTSQINFFLRVAPSFLFLWVYLISAEVIRN